MAKHKKTRTVDANNPKTKTIVRPLKRPKFLRHMGFNPSGMGKIDTDIKKIRGLPPKDPLEGLDVYEGLPPKDPKKESRKPIKKGKK